MILRIYIYIYKHKAWAEISQSYMRVQCLTYPLSRSKPHPEEIYVMGDMRISYDKSKTSICEACIKLTITEYTTYPLSELHSYINEHNVMKVNKKFT